MIKDFEFFHGVVFARILHRIPKEVIISQYPSKDNASYIIDNKIGIYIKYSTKRLSPWSFTFKKIHQDEISELKSKIGKVYVLLICNDDGVVTLGYDELKQILDENHAEVEWISVSRIRRKMYTIKGSDGKLHFKIGRNEFPHKIFGINDNANLNPID